ncbi:MAG: exo-alpha-sialidase [Candidatus Methanofastidiosia archaeon]
MVSKKIKILSILLLGFLVIIAITINSIITPSISWSEPSILSDENKHSCCPSAVLDDEGKIWVFWRIKENGKRYIVYRIYTDSWGPIMQLTNHEFDSYGPVALNDNSGRIWVFWTSMMVGEYYEHKFYYSIFDGNWSEQMEIPVDNPSIFKLDSAVQDESGNIWVFFQAVIGYARIYYMIYDGTWSEAILILSYPSSGRINEEFPFAILDNSNNIWLFFISHRNDNVGLYYRILDGNWSESVQIILDSWALAPSALIDDDGRIYLFWSSRGNIKNQIFYKIFEKGSWGKTIQVARDQFSNYSPSAVQDESGKIWLFFFSEEGTNSVIRYIVGNNMG